jgi:hypothetical protein
MIRTSQPSREFILGIIAGEGTFGVTFRKRDGYTAPEPYSGVKMKNEEMLLNSIKSKVGVGTVYSKKNNMYSWQLHGINLNQSLIEWIDESRSELFVQSRKYDSYKQWKDCISFIQEKGFECKRGKKLEQLLGMAANINNHFTSKEQLMEKYYQEGQVDISKLDI